ncbi:Uncharacterised protein [Klebsiella pneumoniae]|nr:Uncharacterised protein [Klebsiella pneumoniae]
MPITAILLDMNGPVIPGMKTLDDFYYFKLVRRAPGCQCNTVRWLLFWRASA